MTTTNKRRGMAISSLVLGIFSVMCLGLFAGIPAIILGHTARGRARREPERYSGQGLAMTGLALGYASIFTTLLLLGILLPALAKAKSRAQSIVCINNLKQVGLAFRVWSSDHQGQFPQSVSTNKNASVLNQKTADDPTDVEIFQTLGGLLGSPKLLVCPGDQAKHPATMFGALRPENITYELETGPWVTESNPEQVLARCPIHGHELYCDGSVQQRRGGRGR